ncbi:uncharacterized protein BX664DRAFT_358112 [Halteromyces radiatus]|uniref:uncharacterized protein n=1 Tax=Halteromyces radiatus TaxID=101107 RepID=UPI00221FC0FB|nr:uncharacterized protein BX664DRAFT_358112 [Halteromyces radiatus]KAI8093699.1 hypothetical protein BX664DRAFT_358112 [Halteromyces radiatus]
MNGTLRVYAGWLTRQALGKQARKATAYGIQDDLVTNDKFNYQKIKDNLYGKPSKEKSTSRFATSQLKDDPRHITADLDMNNYIIIWNGLRNCDIRMEHFTVDNNEVYTLMYCGGCNRIHNRDKNAAANMWKLIDHHMSHGNRSPTLTRQNQRQRYNNGIRPDWKRYGFAIMNGITQFTKNPYATPNKIVAKPNKKSDALEFCGNIMSPQRSTRYKNEKIRNLTRNLRNNLDLTIILGAALL